MAGAATVRRFEDLPGVDLRGVPGVLKPPMISSGKLFMKAPQNESLPELGDSEALMLYIVVLGSNPMSQSRILCWTQETGMKKKGTPILVLYEVQRAGGDPGSWQFGMGICFNENIALPWTGEGWTNPEHVMNSLGHVQYRGLRWFASQYGEFEVFDKGRCCKTIQNETMICMNVVGVADI